MLTARLNTAACGGDEEQEKATETANAIAWHLDLTWISPTERILHPRSTLVATSTLATPSSELSGASREAPESSAVCGLFELSLCVPAERFERTRVYSGISRDETRSD